jgi:Uma2 family endonuclease
VVAVTPLGHGFTVDDLDRFPDDGNRYELIEGSLHVTPSPAMPHQRALRNLFLALHTACPPEFEVWFAPLDVVFRHDTVLQPDAFVLPADAPSGKRVVTTPLLAAEVLSPSTCSYDQLLKREVYRSAGIGTYLVIDADEPSVRAWTWTWTDGGETYVEAIGDEPLDLDRPFPIRLVPSALV